MFTQSEIVELRAQGGEERELDIAIELEFALLLIFHQLDDLGLVGIGVEDGGDIDDKTEQQNRYGRQI